MADDHSMLLKANLKQLRLPTMGAEFAKLARQAGEGLIELDGGEVRTTRAGLMQVDRLLVDFFREEHRTARLA